MNKPTLIASSITESCIEKDKARFTLSRTDYKSVEGESRVEEVKQETTLNFIREGNSWFFQGDEPKHFTNEMMIIGEWLNMRSITSNMYDFGEIIVCCLDNELKVKTFDDTIGLEVRFDTYYLEENKIEVNGELIELQDFNEYEEQKNHIVIGLAKLMLQ